VPLAEVALASDDASRLPTILTTKQLVAADL
jgi:hypothetical protein